jgi:hypothetical protein
MKSGILILILLFSPVIFALSVPTPKAHALDPTIVSSCNVASLGGPSVGCSLSGVIVGHTIIAAMIWTSESSSCPAGVSSAHDALGNGYTQIFYNACFGVPVSNWKWAGVVFDAMQSATATIAPAITIAGSCVQCTFMAFDVSGLATRTLAGSALGNGTCPSSCLTYPLAMTDAVSYVGNDVLIGLMGCDSDCLAPASAGSGFSAVTPSGAPHYTGIQYATSVGVASPSLFPFNLRDNATTDWLEMGVVIGSTPLPITVIVVKACTWYQLECWLYPLFFYGIYAVVPLTVGFLAKASPRAMAYLMMSVLTYASMIAVILGMLSSQLLIVNLLIDVVYALKFSGRI